MHFEMLRQFGSWSILNCLISAWLIFGVPSLLASFFIKRFTQLRFRLVALLLPFLGLLFGIAAGHFGAWADHHDAYHDPCWYEVFAIPGAPGYSIADSYLGDFQWDEAWEYRNDIAVWNGLFWLSVATAAVFVMKHTPNRTVEPTHALAGACGSP